MATNREHMPLVSNELAPRILILDFWRLFSLFVVVVSHLAFNSTLKRLVDPAHLKVVVANGTLGVFFFFFISGYVVSKAALKETKTLGTFSLNAFYIRRIFRIIPALTIYLTFCLLLGSLGYIDFGLHEFASASLYLCNINIAAVSCNWYSGHTWSLAYEEQFYLLFPIIFCFIEFRKKPNLFMTAILLAIAILPLIFPEAGATMLLRVYAMFLLGYFCANHSVKVIRLTSKIPLIFIPIFLLIIFFPYMLFMKADGTLPRIAIALAIPLLIMRSTTLGEKATLFICRPWIIYLGQISYSLYLWQELATSNTFFGGSLEVAIGLLLAIVPLCSFLFEFVEKPFIRFGRSISAKVQLQSLGSIRSAARTSKT